MERATWHVIRHNSGQIVGVITLPGGNLRSIPMSYERARSWCKTVIRTLYGPRIGRCGKYENETVSYTFLTHHNDNVGTDEAA